VLPHPFEPATLIRSVRTAHYASAVSTAVAEQMLAEYRDQEFEAREALATGDPLAI